MIWIEIIVLIGLVILLVAMLHDKKKHPEDYEISHKQKKRRHNSDSEKWPPLPWTWWLNDKD